MIVTRFKSVLDELDITGKMNDEFGEEGHVKGRVSSWLGKGLCHANVLQSFLDSTCRS